ncbi:MAG: hypothetical protein V3T83_17995 [Acidobacteriota bacterium]
MRKTIQVICLIAALAPFLACGKKRAINPTPPSAQPSAPAPAPATPSAPASTPDPGPVRVDWLAKADLAYLGQSYQEAIQNYRRYLGDPLAPKRDHAHFRLGLLTAWQGNYAEAIRQLKAVRTDTVKTETRIQVALLIPLLERASQDAEEKRDLKQTLNDIMKKLDS